VQPDRIKTLLDRLVTISSDELAHRLRVFGRTQSQRLAVSVRGSAWDRSAIVDALVPGVLGPETHVAIERRDWNDVDQRMRHVLRGRPSRFVLDPARTGELRTAIISRNPDAPAQAARTADELCAGRFNLLGFEQLSFATGTGETDWHLDPVHRQRVPAQFWADVPFLDPSCGDHKIIWELNRHQFFFQLGRAWWLTGNRRYAEAITNYVWSWLPANQPLIGINWASMLELALRSISWLTAIHFLLAEPGDDGQSEIADVDRGDEGPWLLDMCLAVDRQLTHIEQNLSYYYSPNTHLTGEALALYVAGVALPEFSRSARWLDVGRRVLLTEIDRQIGADGGHAERATYYHRYTLDFYELALLTAERAGDIEAVAVFSEAVSRLARFLRALADDNGRIPLIGDDDGGTLWTITERDPRDVRDSLALADVLLNRQPLSGDLPEEVLWLAWSARAGARPETRDQRPRTTDASPITASAFPTTGYVVARSRDGDHLVFDVGPHGFLNGGHAHADALSLTLTLGSQPFLIDPGTATYTIDSRLRDRLRGTASHNTLTLDGRPSAVPAGPFAWATRADSSLATLHHNGGFVWAEAFHDAFGTGRHRRTLIYSAAGGCLVVDEILARGDHLATTHWQFDPQWRVTCDGPRRLCATADDRTAWLLTDRGTLAVRSGDSDGVGWCSPRYGVLVPTSTAHVTHGGRGPFSMIAWVGGSSLSGRHRTETELPTLETVPLESAASAAAFAVRVAHEDRVTVTLVCPGSTIQADRSYDVADYQTDARLLQYSRDRSGCVELSIADGNVALAHGDRLLSLRAESVIADLHARLHDDCLDLYSSSPPPRLFLWGDVITSAVTVRLNGREVNTRYDERNGNVTISGADWLDTSRVRPLLRRATDRRRVPEPEFVEHPVARRA
jgi:hypothetical protein